MTSRGVAASVAVFVAGVALIVAAFVPWLSAGGTDVNGWHLTGDARVLFVVGIIAIGLGSLILAGYANTAMAVVLAAGAAICGAYAVSDMVDITAGNVHDVVHGRVHVGPGPWLVVAAAILLIVGATLAATSRQRTPSTHHPDDTNPA